MLAAQFIRRSALIFIFSGLSFHGAHAQTGTRKAPEVQTPADKPAPAAPAPATSTPPAGHPRVHPAGRRPGPAAAPKVAPKPAN
jgi:hypothetical protein